MEQTAVGLYGIYERTPKFLKEWLAAGGSSCMLILRNRILYRTFAFPPARPQVMGRSVQIIM